MRKDRSWSLMRFFPFFWRFRPHYPNFNAKCVLEFGVNLRKRYIAIAFLLGCVRFSLKDIWPNLSDTSVSLSLIPRWNIPEGGQIYLYRFTKTWR